jgi:hypothetical protein
VLVAIVEQNSGPGGSIHACQTCVDRERLLPVKEHPPGSLGGLHYWMRAAR